MAKHLKSGDLVRDADGTIGYVREVVVIPGMPGRGQRENIYVDWRPRLEPISHHYPVVER